MEPLGLKSLVVNREVVGPFEEEKGRIGIASDIIEVEGEDLAAAGCLREDRVRRYVGGMRRFSIVSVCLLGSCKETPGPNIGLIKQCNTHFRVVDSYSHLNLRMIKLVLSQSCFQFAES